MSGQTTQQLEDKTSKKNGFEPPFDELQILSWILFPTFVTFWFTAILPVLPTPWNSILTVAFAGIFITVVVFAYKTMVSDPVDKYQNYSSESLEKVIPKHCYVCKRDVLPLSLHCRLCKKCVDGFDHHCKWLNTCIGRHNYKIFYVTLSSATGLVVFEVIVEIVLIICFVVDKGSLQTTLSRFYGGGSGSIDSWLIATSIMLALMVPVGALLVQLWTFHVGLIRDKTTTYAYLRDLQQKNAEKMRKKRLGINASKKEKKKKKKKGHDDKAGAVYPVNYNESDIFLGRSFLHSIFFCASPDRSNLTHLPYEKDAANIQKKERRAKQAAAANDHTNGAAAAVDVEDVRIPEKVEKISTV